MAMLTPAHRHQLEVESAIARWVLDEEGVRSLAGSHELPTPDEAFRHPDPEKGRRFGHWPRSLGPGILFPIADPYGQVTFHYRPDRPRLRDGKPVRYEACSGARLAIHVPKRVRSLLSDRTAELWVTEGAKKVYAGLGEGLAIIGLMGVDGFVTRVRDRSEPLPDWDAIVLDGRLVFIAFDSDVMTKPEVKGARDRLAGFLASRGATAVPVTIPEGSHDG
jgi:putative DNA primase/helicase